MKLKINFNKLGLIPHIFGLVGLAFIFLSLPYELFYQYFYIKAKGIPFQLLPGFNVIQSGVAFKREFIAFLLIQTLVISSIGIYFLIKLISIRRVGFVQIPKWGILFLMVSCVVLELISRDAMIRMYLLIAFGFLSLNILLINEGRVALTLANLISKGLQQLIYICKFLLNEKFLFLLLLLLCIFILNFGKSSWYPLALPNDYYEISDQYIVKGLEKDEVLSKSAVQKYLENSVLETPRTDKFQQLISAIGFANGWQSETGRILYHHSYIFIPAAHFLKYGFDTSTPYLYGYGNTIFHAVLMKIYGGGISGYFYSYPLTLLFGAIILACIVSYCLKNKWLGTLAFIICIYELYSVGFTAALLAASFSPARYIGLGVQIASVFLVLRSGNVRKIYLICLALVFSIFWNKEFALIGLVAQVLALYCTEFKFRFWFSRIIWSICLISIYLLMALVLFSSDELISTNFLGFYQVNMPTLNGKDAVLLLGFIFVIECLFLSMSFTYDGVERYARLCVLPVIFLTLIKVVFNPSAPHLAVSLAFFLPFSLIYLPNLDNRNFQFLKKNKAKVLGFAFITFGAGAIHVGQKYLDEANYIRKYTVQPFVSKSWRGLGENLPMVADGDTITERVTAIKNVSKLNDRLLILSPFDHLLAFYLNPPGYCGHFELVSNLVRENDAEKVISCVSKSPNLLIVYDKSLLIACPNLEKIGFESNCKNKLTAKRNVANLINEIPDLYEVSRDGDLIFYRQSKAHSIPKND